MDDITTPTPTAGGGVRVNPKVKRAGRLSGIPLLVKVAATWSVLICLLALLTPWLPIDNPNVPDYDYIAGGPSAAHWLGTDELGRDIFSRIIFGARASLTVGFVAALLGLTVGMTLGLLAGFFRGWVDAVISTVVDVVLSFPALIFIMVLVSVRGPSPQILILGLGGVMVPTFTRLARANTMAWSQREFVTAATALGSRRLRTLFREIFPNVLPSLLAYAFVVVAVVMVAEGSTSFLGFGLQPPTPSWGSMIATGRQLLAYAPHVVAFPAATLLLTVWSFNLVGDYLRGRTTSDRSDVVL